MARLNKVLISHLTGNANVRHAALALQQAELLEEFTTSIAVFPGTIAEKVGALPGLGELKRRMYPAALHPFTRCHPFREVVRSLAPRLWLSGLIKHETGFASVDECFRSIDRNVAGRLKDSAAHAIYAYEDGALESFRAAKQCSKTCLYDLPIGYWRAGRAIMSEEGERRPEWIPTMQGLIDSDAKLARKDEELRLADAIVVASSFTKSTLSAAPFPIAPVEVIPYGAPTSVDPGQAVTRERNPNSPLRILFVGGLSQRKGIADLLEAVVPLGRHVELTIIGRGSLGVCKPLDDALAANRYIPSLPHAEILREMHEHDVFVFPSLFEGFGLVILEAMAQGLPVITTSHTAGPDVIRDGEGGFIVSIRDPQAITAKLDFLLCNPTALHDMKNAARTRAAEFTWEAYRRRLADWVRSAVGGGKSC